VVSIHQTDNISPYNMSSSTRSNETTDRQISDLMLLPPALVRYKITLIFYVSTRLESI